MINTTKKYIKIEKKYSNYNNEKNLDIINIDDENNIIRKNTKEYSLLSIKVSKTQENYWNFYSVFYRKLYSRSGLTYLRNVFPCLPKTKSL